ncbi:TrbC/VirB2 family protein [Rhodanobacter sp. DHG33]|uniref:TrbC/VirB2 family protein n=1 Tax=Rhodanobacter sp. DHG33 TaxID=2775921 RepID=UPI001785B89C|nr:TrbC/VirB2 family protein [Rhodanobacter sp. DHG33]MBD8900001.1 TrbC/VirB2 family protein [Rhodanobacter sp. DHG33]
MAPNQIVTDSLIRSSRARLGTFLYLAVLIALIVPGIAFGQDAGETISTTCTFAANVTKILNAISIVVVTIAVIFSGYQIAFAHKRIGDVAPVLIGSVLIGAASQIANMFLKTSAGSSACSAPTSMVTHAVDHYAMIAHFVGYYA